MFLSQPRWGRGSRIGKVTINYRIGLTVREIEQMTIDEIHERLTSLLAHDEFDHQRKVMVSYRSQAPAEWLEQALFLCPHCRAIGKTASRKDRFFCVACGYQVKINSYGFFEPAGARLYFDTMADWDQWQLAELRKMVCGAAERLDPNPVFSDGPLVLLNGPGGLRGRRFPTVREGAMELLFDRLRLVDRRRGILDLDLRRIRGMNVQDGEILEFHHDGILHRIRTRIKMSSVKWVRAVQFLHHQLGIHEDGSIMDADERNDGRSPRP